MREVLNLKEASPKVDIIFGKYSFFAPSCFPFLIHPHLQVTNMKDGLPSSKNSPALKPTSSSAPKLLKTSNSAERLDPTANSESYERSDKVFDVEQDLKKEEKCADQQQEDEIQTRDNEVVDLSESYEVKRMSK